MKKKSLLVLLFALVCLLTVGCGKDKEEEKEDKKDTISTKTLHCTYEIDSDKDEMIITQNSKTFEITKASMTIKTDISNYGEPLTEAKLQKMACAEEDAYISCTAKLDGDISTVEKEFKPDVFGDEMKASLEVEELDADSLTSFQEYLEKYFNEVSCSIK